MSRKYKNNVIGFEHEKIQKKIFFSRKGKNTCILSRIKLTVK